MHDPTTRLPAAQPNTSPIRAIDPLLTAKEAADYRRQGISTFWRHVRQGLVPRPVYITDRSPRWRLSDLCPARQSATPQK
jgi:predicted DNA-binding transcriptional regulator AlpA